MTYLRLIFALNLSTLTLSNAFAEEPNAEAMPGQKVFVCGHSFHAWVGGPLEQCANQAGIKDHKNVGVQMLGGSRVQQHWDLPDDKNKAKKALKTGEVDVFTVSPHLKLPDDGIDNYTALMLEHNPKGRVYVQASWYPFDLPGKSEKNFKNLDRDSVKVADIREGYKPFEATIKKQVDALNTKYADKKRQVVFIVPVGQAVYALRDKIVDGKVPGVKQSDLFFDGIGHPNPQVIVLTTYCFYAAVYGKSPVGLPMPKMFAESKFKGWDEKFNTMLQEIAWDAVTSDPLSGVKKK